MSHFESKSELIDALAHSCFIPLYSGFSFPKQGNEWIIDGAYTDNLPLFEVSYAIKSLPKFTPRSIVMNNFAVKQKNVKLFRYEFYVN